MKNNLESTGLHSEEVVDILGKIPGKLTRWGAALITFIVLLMLACAAIIHYPDTIRSEIVITALNPPVRLKSNAGGYIESVFVADKDTLTAGCRIAYLHNAAHFNHVAELKNWTDTILFSDSIVLPEYQHWLLGDLQLPWNNLLSAINEHHNQKTTGYYSKKIQSLKIQLLQYQQYVSKLKKQTGSLNEEIQSFKKQYVRDSILRAGDVIADAVFETTRAQYFQKKSSLENSEAFISQTLIKISECEQNLLDLQLTMEQKNRSGINLVKEQVNNLKNALAAWELAYVIKAPVDGVVSFSPTLLPNNPVLPGEHLCTMVSDKKAGYIGRALLPVSGSGKVFAGNQVIIKPDNFPYMDYGIVYGNVKSISVMPQENQYTVEIILPDGLTTSYGKLLSPSGEIHGKAEIITQHYSLLDRLIKPVYAALND
jgi:hypothetical protein